MKKNRILLSIVLLIFLLVIYVGVNYTKLRSVYSKQEDIENKIKDMKIYVGGETVGIKLLATGVLVMGVDSETSDKLNIGDIILTVNGENVDTGEKLSKIAEESNGNELNLEVNRQGKKYNTKILPKYDSISGEYKLGVFVKDSSAGVGTVTFYEGNSKRFAALGHGVTETKENYILPITSGAITSTHIYNVKRGEAQNPGEIKGTITSNVLGEKCGKLLVSETKIEKCECGGRLIQDEDTLDTWFSSALWPFSVFGWPDETEDFKYFYPTTTLVTGYDIIPFWVSKMIFSGIAYTGNIPNQEK